MTEKYTFKQEMNNEGVENEYPDNLVVTVEFTGEQFSELVTGFKQFARAIGFADVTIDQYFVNDERLYRRRYEPL